MVITSSILKVSNTSVDYQHYTCAYSSPTGTQVPARTYDPLAHLGIVERFIIVHILEARDKEDVTRMVPDSIGHDVVSSGPSTQNSSLQAQVSTSVWRGVQIVDLARETRKRYRRLTAHDIMYVPFSFIPYFLPSLPSLPFIGPLLSVLIY